MSSKLRKSSFFSVALVVICFVFVMSSYADQYHYNNILIGERPAGLGGAYTALSDDPSGLYYNPAGIVFSAGSNLSASVNAYHRSVKEYDSVLGGKGWERKSSALLPNFFGIIQPLWKGKIGFSYAVTDSIVEDQDQEFTNLPSTVDTDITRYVINFNNEDTTYNFGPSYALQISEDFSIGTTLYVHYRRNEWILNQFITLDNTVANLNNEYTWLNNYYETEEWGIRPVLGLMWSPSDANYSLGLAFSRTFVLDSETTIQNTCAGYDWDSDGDTFNDTDTCGGDPAVDDVRRIDVESDDKREHPYVVTLGAAYFPTHSLLFSGDVSYYSETDYGIIGESNRRSLINAAVGAEYYFTDSVALRGGFFTNFTNTEEADSSEGQPEHVDMYGGSLSLSYFTKGSSITLGTSYSYGTGEAQIVEGVAETQDLTVSALTIYISASYAY